MQRLAAVHDAFALPPALATALAGLAGPVLLVDDVVDSGWTMTVAARLVRRAGRRPSYRSRSPSRPRPL